MSRSSHVEGSIIETGIFSEDKVACDSDIGIGMMSSWNDGKETTKPSIGVSGTVARLSSEDDESSFVTIGKRKIPRLNWTRLNYDEENHDNRRLIEHRKRDCQCEICYRELNKLPPEDPVRLKMEIRKKKLEEREIRRVKKKAKMEVTAGKQASIRNFFRY